VTLFARITKNLRNNLLAGLAVMAPIGVTIYAFNMLFESVDAILGPRLNDLLVRSFPRAFGETRIPGLGIVATLILLYVTGSLMRSYVGKQLYRLWESSINKAAKQVMTAISGSGGFHRVVLVHIEEPDSYVIGFVTGDMQIKSGEIRKNVFIPTAPNPTTGVLALMKPEQLVESDLSVEEAMRLIVSAGLVERSTPETS
jgi:uncharacterized membrane protein